MNFKLGRNPRTFKNIPHMSALLGAIELPPVPKEADWTQGRTSFGMMLNDTLGDCTIAALYHQRQIWTMNTFSNGIQTESDATVLKLYENACGYNPKDPSTDCGGIEQDVLAYIKKNGLPLTDGTISPIVDVFEIDCRNLDDVRRTISDFGGVYTGFDCLSSMFDANGNPKKIWQSTSGRKVGGHAVMKPKYNENYFGTISWGGLYQETTDFFLKQTEEAYAIICWDWLKASGVTPLGKTVDDLHAIVENMKIS